MKVRLLILSTVAGGAFVVCIALSSAPWCFEHCGIGRWLQTSGRWSVVLKSRIWSYPGGDKYSFVDDVCPQYLHCTDEDQQSETARLSTVESSSPPGSFVGMIPSSNRFNEWPAVWMVNTTASRRSGLFKFQVFDSMADEVFLTSLSSMVQRIDNSFLGTAFDVSAAIAQIAEIAPPWPTAPFKFSSPTS